MMRLNQFAGALLLPATLAIAGVPDLGTEAQRAAGKALYKQKCSQCHGEYGDGRGVGAKFFAPLPRDFTSGAYKIRTTESGELPTTGDLKAIIRRGMPHTGMPAWPGFKEEELGNLAYYLKTFNPDFADPAANVEPMKGAKVPDFTEASAARGRKVFEANKCMDCHGNLGRGDGESGPTLKDDAGQAIRPADLTKPWTFRGGPTREDIYRTFVTGLNGTPMPSYASSIESEEDRWALVDYVHSLSRGGRDGKAPYAAVAVAEPAAGPVDLARGRDLFKEAKPALFPVVGQVIQGRRAFHPAIDAVEVRAVYDSASVAFMVSWHDMAAEKSGGNSPLDPPTGADTAAPRSDAVALQLPLNPLEGAARPYFLFGDASHPVELWYRDLAAAEGKRYIGKGNGALTSEGTFATASGYADGEWWVAFVRKRTDGKRLALHPGDFVPIAVSVWDGFSGETGSARGVTSWYSLYLRPGGGAAPVVPAAKAALGLLAAELALLWFLRRQFVVTGK
ncbi:MAG TPA: c-type cytochrome [Fibrobacteria bacterium]|nr:c-type cytochrome [Fibrobacteria bacterium]